jgi:hypothetical protein
MVVYIYVNARYGEYEQRMNPANYGRFKQLVEEYFDKGVLLQIDDKIQKGKEELVNYIFNELPEAKMYGEKPLFMVDNADEECIDAVIQICRDLHYCHIWEDDPIERKLKLSLKNGDSLIYLLLEAEAG